MNIPETSINFTCFISILFFGESSMSLKLVKASLQIWIAWRLLFLFSASGPHAGSNLVRWDNITSIYSLLKTISQI